jgi:hypothetical protein
MAAMKPTVVGFFGVGLIVDLEIIAAPPYGRPFNLSILSRPLHRSSREMKDFPEKVWDFWSAAMSCLYHNFPNCI